MQPSLRGRPRVLAALVTTALVVLGLLALAPTPAQAAPRPAGATTSSSKPTTPDKNLHFAPAACASTVGLPAGHHWAHCMALGLTGTDGKVKTFNDGPPSTSVSPADLQQAYQVPTNGGDGDTVAIVDEGGYANAESDLAVYRSTYGLPACTAASGCFKVIDQRGGNNLPPEDPKWSTETALDLDAVSAICPGCKLLLVLADTSDLNDLGQAAYTAAQQPGVVAVSNSYGGDEFDNESDYDHFYDTPGVAQAVSTGDTGNVTSFPAMSPLVTAVGGTLLTRDDATTRGWDESAWADGGSGCSPFEPKPAFQEGLATGCDNRANADISADADPQSGLAVYNTSGQNGWSQWGGTSLAAPLVAGMYAMAGKPTPGSYPNTYPYEDPNAGDDLNDITVGWDGYCGDVLCQSGTGWDGPTGLGTPAGLGALTEGPHGDITGTVVDQDGKPISGATVTAASTTLTRTYHTTSKADGTFDLAAPVDTYDVTVSLFGYGSQKLPGLTVTDGGTLTESVHLTKEPSHTVTGTVTDGSGHGWPLYARLTVSGYPNGAIYTDPATGRYSVDLPDNASYSVRVTAPDMPGYKPTALTLQTSSAPTTQDVTLTSDTTSCLSAGYKWNYTGDLTTFNDWLGNTPQGGWTVTNSLFEGGTWEFDDPAHWGNLTGGDGNFAIMDSGYFGIGPSEDTSLVSPVIDMSQMTDPVVGFDTAYAGGGSQGDVDYTVDGGHTWINVWRETDSDIQGHVELALPQAAGQSAVQVRFHDQASGGYFWEVDNVYFGHRSCDPVAGGLVEGTVNDALTGKPVDGARVGLAIGSGQTSATESGMSTGQADDAAHPAGHYWVFSPAAGTKQYQATDDKYASAVGNVTVADDQVTVKDWSLQAGRAALSAPAVSISQSMGGTGKTSVTLKNTGTQPMHIELGERSGGFKAMNGGLESPVVHLVGPTSKLPSAIGGQALPRKAAVIPAGTSWTKLADMPAQLMDEGAALVNGKEYVFGGSDGNNVYRETLIYDPSKGRWLQGALMPHAVQSAQVGVINGYVYVAGGWDASGDAVTSVYRYYPPTDSWSQVADLPVPLAAGGSAVLDGQMYMMGGCESGSCSPASPHTFRYDPGTNTWSKVADYPIMAEFTSCAGIASSVVCAGGTSPYSADDYKSTYSYNPGTDTWSQKANMPFSDWGAVTGGANNKLQVVGGVGNGFISNASAQYDPVTDKWSSLPAAPVAVYRAAGSCGLYMAGGSDGSNGSFSPTAGAATLPGYESCTATSDVSWLKTSVSSLDLQPGESGTVTITANTGDVSQPGTYSAEVAVSTDTPYAVAPIKVAMHVAPPKSWAKLQGTVTTNGKTPAKGATVDICSNVSASGTCGPVRYTLTTDATGHYQVWLDQSFSRLSVIAHLDGYTAQSRVVGLTAGKTSTANFTLAAPYNKVPVRMSATLSRSSIVAGTRAKVTVAVAAAGSVPTGKVTVTVRGHGKVWHLTGTLRSGRVTVTLPALYTPAKYTVQASYGGTSLLQAGNAPKHTLTVTKKKTSTKKSGKKKR